MKKITLYIFIILLLSGCSNKEYENKEITNTVEPTTTTTPIPKYVDDNPITVGLYLDDTLVDTFESPLSYNTDVAWFNVYYTNEAKLDSTNVKYNWNKYYNNYQNIDNYKIGFYLNFYVGDEFIEQTILDPSKKHELDDYMYNYLYDDIHVPDNTWYSHLEMEDVKDNTLYTSIKLFSRAEAYKITSPIKFTVFTYDSDDDFDEQGHYRGNSKYTITITKKNG